jgi:5'-nucleotidase
MKILVSNDDGVHAPGINILANTLAQIADISVVAPDRNRSGASNSLTLLNPIRLNRLENGHLSVQGTPTDCVHLALTGLMEATPDFVVSGINAGANLGEDVFYSGTVAAAMEGCFLGRPAIAISLAGHHEVELKHYATAAQVAKQIILRMQQHNLPAKTLLNINVPDIPLSKLQGFEVTRLGTRHYAEKTLPAKDPRGRTVYWIGPSGPEQDAGPGTDFYAINNRKVSITSISLDLTDYAANRELKQWIKGLAF